MRFLTLVFSVLFPALTVFQPAQAATGAGAAAQFEAAPLKLTEYNPLKVKNKGPGKAVGIVYFVDGLDSHKRSRDDYHATYPYIYGLNTRDGWDVIAAKFPNAEHYSFNSIPGSSKYIIARLAALKAQGYKRVILAGQSWGAWVTVDVARRDGADKVIDAILLTAPANYGMRVFNGKPNPYFGMNKSEYLENIKTIRIPTIATFFRDDEFDPGGRGPITRDTLKRNGVPAVVIDNPAHFLGHGAGWLPEFDYAYRACINAFLKQPKDGECNGPATPSDSDIGSVSTEEQVVAGGGKLVSLKDIKDKTYIVTSPRGYVTVEQYGRVIAKVLSDRSEYSAQMMEKDDKICFSKACSRFYQLKDGALIGFGSDGNWTVKMTATN